jgi:hypothetical protein
VTDHDSNPAIGEPLMERPAVLTLAPSALTTGTDPDPASIDPASMPDVTEALRLYDLGLAVVPAVQKDGSPCRGHHKWATRLPRGKTEWFFPEARGWTIALLPGLCSVLLVVVDCDDNPALEEAERRYGQSPIVIRTPRGVGAIAIIARPPVPCDSRTFGPRVGRSTSRRARERSSSSRRASGLLRACPTR